MMRYFSILLITFLVISCNQEPLNSLTGIWQIVPADRKENFDIEILDFRDNGKLTIDFDKIPYGSLDRKIEIDYEQQDWENRNAIWVAFTPSKNFLVWAYPEINSDTLTMTLVRGEKLAFRYSRLK